MSEYIVSMYCADEGVKCEEIVRCRDCKEFTFGDVECATVDWCDYWGTYVELPDGFCAWGERKEGGDD